MSLKFKCTQCGNDIVVQFLKAGDTAKCFHCGAEIVVPLNASSVNELADYKVGGSILKQDQLKTESAVEIIVTPSFLGPRNFMEIIEVAFNVYFKNFVKFLLIISPIIIIDFIFYFIVMPEIIKFSSIFNQFNPSFQLEKTFLIRLYIMIPISLILNLMTTGAIIHAAADQNFNSIDLKRSYLYSLRRFFQLLSADVLKGISITLMAITIIGLPFAVYYIFRWIFTNEVVIIEKSNVNQAFARSSQLFRDKKGRNRIFGVSIIFGIILMVVQQIPYLGMLLGALVTPITTIAMVYLYFDLRVRQEGYLPMNLARELDINQSGKG